MKKGRRIHNAARQRLKAHRERKRGEVRKAEARRRHGKGKIRVRMSRAQAEWRTSSGKEGPWTMQHQQLRRRLR